MFVLVVVLTLSGCAGGGTYTAGYSASYYAPDYSPFYGDYGYGGDSWWGPGPFYYNEVVIHGGHHRLYYGGHHLMHDRPGGFGDFGRGRRP